MPTARRFVESVLTGWGLSDLGWTAAILTTELATNCALHAGTSFRVRVQRTGEGTVRLEVSDGSVRLPQQRHHSATSTTGRGLRIVGDLSAAWGVSTADDGKTVWVDLTDAGDDGGRRQDDIASEDELDGLLNAFGDDDGTVVLSRWPVTDRALAAAA